MLVDAIRAETFKLVKNNRTSFFAWLFLPLAALLLGLIGEFWLEESMRPGRGGPLPQVPFNLGEALISSVQPMAFPLIILFCLIGAAVIFAGEYRWETWRLMAPRNSRTNSLLGKILVYAGAAGLSFLLYALFSVLAGIIGASADGQTISGPLNGDGWRVLFASFGVGWLHLLQAGAVAALAAVLTRSILAALMVPLGLGLAQSILHAITSSTTPLTEMEWWRPLAMPSLAADLLRGSLQTIPMPGMEIPEMLVWASWAAFAVWILGGFGAAVALFLRQDLSKE